MSNKSGHFYIPCLLGDIAFVTKLHIQINRGPYLGVRIPKTDKAYVMHSVFNLNLSSILEMLSGGVKYRRGSGHHQLPQWMQG
jgi:hypothetical protein